MMGHEILNCILLAAPNDFTPAMWTGLGCKNSPNGGARPGRGIGLALSIPCWRSDSLDMGLDVDHCWFTRS